MIDTIDIHPLSKDSAIIPTRPLENCVNSIITWLDNLIPGGIIYGTPRVGKTQAVKFLEANTEILLGHKIPAVLMTMWEPGKSTDSESRFFGAVLTSLGYALPSGAAQDRRIRAADYMIERAKQLKEHRFLFFIDEAQWISKVQYRYLMDLHNILKLADVRIIVILVGQSELLTIKNDFRKTKQKQLLGRFMTMMHHFEGVMGSKDFRRIIRSLDSGSEFPESSGCSYTCFFVPLAFESGWRLLNYSDLIWKTLIETCRREGIPKIDELPMQPITALLRWILHALSKIDSSTLELEQSVIEEAVYRVALLQIEDHAWQNEQDKL